jgi:hypothetical protein
MASHHPDAGAQPRLNWSLLLALGLCVEFWIIVTTAVAEKL